MDWINCNSCCRQPGDEKERTFVLTSCGHIFCDLCLAQAESREKCAACSTRCQLIQLSSKMKPDAEMFFLEPGELIKRHYTQINRLLEFQKEHRIRLVSFHRRIIQKYKDLEKQHKSTCGSLQESEKKFLAASKHIHELEGENRKLREMMSQAGSAAPSSSPSLYTTPHTSYQRAITNQRTSPHVSPGGTRISPGRLTLVKSTPGTSRSPTHQHPPTSATYAPSNRSSHSGQFGSSPQPYTSTGMVQTPAGSGMNYPRHNTTLAQSRTPSPTRGVNSMARFTPLSQSQHFHPSTAVKSSHLVPHHAHGQTGYPMHHGPMDQQRLSQHRYLSPQTIGGSPLESLSRGGAAHNPYRYPI